MILSSKKLISTHGKQLLLELFGGIKYASLNQCLSFISKDPLAGLLRDEETGNNSFHLLLGNDFPSEFVMPVLRSLLEVCPNGAQAKNKQGNIPLHYCLSQPAIIIEAAYLLLSAYPTGAGILDSSGLSPLFLSVMRDNAVFDLSRTICKLCPNAATVRNQTNSLPIHFAAKRKHPNIDILQMLVRRNADGASLRNSFGLLPLHCAAMSTIDEKSLKIIHDAFPAAIELKDRQGRNCLHLAVLAVGKKHSKAVDQEARDELQERSLRLAEQQGASKKEVEDDYDDDEDDEDLSPRSGEMEERYGHSRASIRLLLSLNPMQLVEENNFLATPVETILEKTRPKETKKKKVSVFGLYDDPPTARILLSAHKHYARKGILPPLRFRHNNALKELNWLARKEAIFVSLALENRDTASKAAQAQKKGSQLKSSAKKMHERGTQDIETVFNSLSLNPKAGSDEIVNILASLRAKGEIDCLRICVSFI